MHGRVIFVPTSFPSIFEQFVDAGYFTGKLIVEVISLGILKDVFRIEQLLVNEARGEIS
jgi:hypothetical protein